MSFPAPSPTKETSGVAFSVTSRRSLDCGRPTTGSDEGNSSRDFRMNRLAVHHFRYRAPTISREVQPPFRTDSVGTDGTADKLLNDQQQHTRHATRVSARRVGIRTAGFPQRRRR